MFVNWIVTRQILKNARGLRFRGFEYLFLEVLGVIRSILAVL